MTRLALVCSDLKPIRIADLATTPCDEVFLFRDGPAAGPEHAMLHAADILPVVSVPIHPDNRDPIDEANGDGDLLEVWDFKVNASAGWVLAENRTFPVSPDTIVYVR